MTESIFPGVTNTKNLKELRGYLNEINIQLFNPILEHSDYKGEDPFYIITYLVYAYTQESPYIVLHADSYKEKQGICERLQMPEYLRGWVLNLSKADIREVLISYIDYFAGEQWRNLQTMKIQLMDLEGMITGQKFKDKEGIFDPKKHMAAIDQSAKLAKKIEDIEKDLKGRTQYITIAKDEIATKKARKLGRGAAMENSEFVQ